MGHRGSDSRGRICVTVTAPDAAAARACAMRAMDGGASLVEYRLDAMAPEVPF